VVQKANPEDKALKSPRTSFGRNNHYTVTTSGVRDLSIEDALGKVETSFAHVMTRLKRGDELLPKDNVALSFFTAGMRARVESSTNKISKMLRTIQAQADRLAQKNRGTSSELSKEIGESLKEVPGNTVGIGVVETQKILERMSLTIFTVDDDAGFITSDAPCCLCVPGALHPHLGHEGVEVTLPLSPRHLPKCAVLLTSRKQLPRSLPTKPTQTK
jgi:hypothetical protein